MKTSYLSDPLPTIAVELERMLAAARREKTLAQVPALRRLRMVVRVFVIIGALSQILVIPLGFTLHYIHSVIDRVELGFSSFLAYILYCTTLCILTATSWLLLYAYARFLKQFRQNHVRELWDTTEMILRAFRYNLLLATLGYVLTVAMFHNVESITAGLLNLLPMIGMYFVIRRYVNTAQKELPALAAAAGNDSTPEEYPGWKSVFLKLLVLALIVLGLGYAVASVMNPERTIPFDQVLVETSKQINASLPSQLDSETRLDTTMAGPGNRLTDRYTLVNLSGENLDQAIVESIKQQLINNYKTEPSMGLFRSNQVELHYRYRRKDGNTAATIVVSPKDF